MQETKEQRVKEGGQGRDLQGLVINCK